MKNMGKFDIDIRISTSMVRKRPAHLGATGGDTCTDRFCARAVRRAERQ